MFTSGPLTLTRTYRIDKLGFRREADKTRSTNGVTTRPRLQLTDAQSLRRQTTRGGGCAQLHKTHPSQRQRPPLLPLFLPQPDQIIIAGVVSLFNRGSLLATELNTARSTHSCARQPAYQSKNAEVFFFSCHRSPFELSSPNPCVSFFDSTVLTCALISSVSLLPSSSSSTCSLQETEAELKKGQRTSSFLAVKERRAQDLVGKTEMAGGFAGGTAGAGRAELYEGKITGYFILACIVGSFGGSLFGYDLGVSSKYLHARPVTLLVLDTTVSCTRFCRYWHCFAKFLFDRSELLAFFSCF